jgi:hypothetical protein
MDSPWFKKLAQCGRGFGVSVEPNSRMSTDGARRCNGDVSARGFRGIRRNREMPHGAVLRRR